jgi:hypothetical protein
VNIAKLPELLRRAPLAFQRKAPEARNAPGQKVRLNEESRL